MLNFRILHSAEWDSGLDDFVIAIYIGVLPMTCNTFLDSRSKETWPPIAGLHGSTQNSATNLMSKKPPLPCSFHAMDDKLVELPLPTKVRRQLSEV